jgi:plasmid stabilization system protein ParE
VTTLFFSARALADVERFIDFVLETDADGAQATADLISHAIQVLARHPFIGRPLTGPLRELVISRGASGYVALYSFDPRTDVVTIHALRHQLEAGYRAP